MGASKHPLGRVPTDGVRHVDTIEIGDTHLSACVTMRDKPFSQTLGRPVHIYHSAAARGIMNRLVIQHSWVGRAQNGCSGGSRVAQLGFPNLTRGTALRFVSSKQGLQEPVERRPGRDAGKLLVLKTGERNVILACFFTIHGRTAVFPSLSPKSHAKANRTKYRQLIPVVLVDQCFIPPPDWLLIVSTLVQPQLGRSVRT